MLSSPNFIHLSPKLRVIPKIKYFTELQITSSKKQKLISLKNQVSLRYQGGKSKYENHQFDKNKAHPRLCLILSTQSTYLSTITTQKAAKAQRQCPHALSSFWWLK